MTEGESSGCGDVFFFHVASPWAFSTGFFLLLTSLPLQAIETILIDSFLKARATAITFRCRDTNGKKKTMKRIALSRFFLCLVGGSKQSLERNWQLKNIL